MKILATSDWHLGNLFHGNDRLSEHRHFLKWLIAQVKEQQPDALLVAGDIFDNGNPSAAAQSAYYAFLADAGQVCPAMKIIITAGNHDSASRLEAPRELLSRHNVEIRGTVRRSWNQTDNSWAIDFSDLMIPVEGKGGDRVVVLAVPYLRNDVVQLGDNSYSEGVNTFLRDLTQKARAEYPDTPLVMMAHMYAKGADIASSDASEKIVIGGQEEVNMEGWADHPDYLTCGHIHKRQHIWNTDWARYTGSVLPMSFAEVDYLHGVDLVTVDDDRRIRVSFLEYHPQHKLRILPADNQELPPKQMKKLVGKELPSRKEGKLDDDFEYVLLKVKIDKVNNDEIKELEALFGEKNAVLCRIQKIIPTINITTINGNHLVTSIDDILNRDPLETLKEAFMAKHTSKMTTEQEQMLREICDSSDLNY